MRSTGAVRRYVAAAAAFLLLGTLVGMRLAPSALASHDVGAPAPSAPTRRAAPPTLTWSLRMVRAAGVRQWIACAGTGRVTVVVVAGLHADHRMWRSVLGSFARTTRTCIYDRPGLGSSPPRLPHRVVDAGLHARELEALLVAARVPGPYVVVGHSYGGLVARAFAAAYRSQIAGLVLVEGVAPFDRLSRFWHEGGDTVDTSLSSVAAARLRLGSTPLVVLAAQDPDRSYWGGPAYGASASSIADWRAHQRAAAALSTESTFVIVRRSAHVVEHDRPDAVIAGVRLIVSAITRGHPLPRCALTAFGSMPLCP